MFSPPDLAGPGMTEFQEQLRLQHEKTMHEELEKLLQSSTGPEAQVGLDHLFSMLRASLTPH